MVCRLVYTHQYILEEVLLDLELQSTKNDLNCQPSKTLRGNPIRSHQFPRTNTDREIIREAVMGMENTVLAVRHHGMNPETIVLLTIQGQNHESYHGKHCTLVFNFSWTS